ncbi:hypothetical protein BJX99DRAFT_205519 [Aspergillus californicus]
MLAMRSMEPEAAKRPGVLDLSSCPSTTLRCLLVYWALYLLYCFKHPIHSVGAPSYQSGLPYPAASVFPSPSQHLRMTDCEPQ